MYQQITVIGHAGGDPVMRYLTDGTPVSTFSVATNRRWKDKAGQQQERTTWHRCSAWNGLAETVAQYVVKGTPIMVIGSVETRPWADSRTGEPRAQLEVRCDTVRFLGSGNGANVSEEPEAAQPAVMGEIANTVTKALAGGDEEIPF